MEGWKLSMQNLQDFFQKYRETAWIFIFLKPVVFYILIFLLYILKFKFQKVLLGSWRELACFYFYY